MPDREKVIKGLEELREYLFHEYEICYHGDQEDIYNRFLIADNAIALLKEPEAVEPDTDSEGTCTCGNCGETVGYYPVGCKTPQRLCKFCPECGRRVKW